MGVAKKKKKEKLLQLYKITVTEKSAEERQKKRLQLYHSQMLDDLTFNFDTVKSCDY